MTKNTTGIKISKIYDIEDLLQPVGFGRYADCTLLYVILADRGY